jgi:uncharacterized protein (DUF4415 family)
VPIRYDADNPPIPSEAFDRAVRIPDMADTAGVLAALAEAKRRGRGPQKTATKQVTNVRLDAAILEHYRASGPGWQTRMNADLARLVARRQRATPTRRKTAKKTRRARA